MRKRFNLLHTFYLLLMAVALGTAAFFLVSVGVLVVRRVSPPTASEFL